MKSDRQKLGLFIKSKIPLNFIQSYPTVPGSKSVAVTVDTEILLKPVKTKSIVLMKTHHQASTKTLFQCKLVSVLSTVHWNQTPSLQPCGALAGVEKLG